MKNQMFKKQGEFLKRKRFNRGLTQTEIAKRLGVSAQLISNFERGLSGIPVGYIRSISYILKINPKQFVDLHVKLYKENVLERI